MFCPFVIRPEPPAGIRGGQSYQKAGNKKMAVANATASQKVTIACCGSALHADFIMISSSLRLYQFFPAGNFVISELFLVIVR
ncbi:hypothetical protein B6S08_11260 [Oceanimonas doudoroffii]|uniref:Uncharacterized protein n=1 Tax=Oceanimonas doudoroffii TaxID=84158 RepID=A0A233RDT7_9GAMM|nr:hypothetical protein B6S08_11260 [Oceanimonas doudoroffii]